MMFWEEIVHDSHRFSGPLLSEPLQSTSFEAAGINKEATVIDDMASVYAEP